MEDAMGVSGAISSWQLPSSLSNRATFDPMSRYKEIKWPKYLSPFRYAIRESSFWLNISFFFTLELWFAQEMFLRDAFPKETHGDLHHFFDILSVMWGSFVTAYLFFWITVHVPEKRKQRAIDIDRERDIAMILRNYFDLIVDLIKGIPRDPDLKENVFKNFYASLESMPTIYPKLVAIRPRTDGNEWPWMPDDPFYMSFDRVFHQIKREIDDLHDIRHTLDPWLYSLVKYSREDLRRNIKNELRDEDQRLEDLQALNGVVADFFKYAEERIKNKKICSSFFKDVYNLRTFQDAWNEAAEEETETVEERKYRPRFKYTLDLDIPSDLDGEAPDEDPVRGAQGSPTSTGDQSPPAASQRSGA